MAVEYCSGDVIAYEFDTESAMRDELENLVTHARTIGTTCIAVLEKVHAMPGNGGVSMFSFGQNFGFWRGVLQGLRIPFVMVTPQAWQKGLVPPKVKGPDRKRALKQLAAERYPNLKVTLKTADALLMLKELN